MSPPYGYRHHTFCSSYKIGSGKTHSTCQVPQHQVLQLQVLPVARGQQGVHPPEEGDGRPARRLPRVLPLLHFGLEIHSSKSALSSSPRISPSPGTSLPTLSFPGPQALHPLPGSSRPSLPAIPGCMQGLNPGRGAA